MREYNMFGEFWLFYLCEYFVLVMCGWYYVGLMLVIGVLFYVLFIQIWLLLLVVLVFGYFFVWVSYVFVECNKLVIFIYLLWLLIVDYKMFGMFFMGKFGLEFEWVGVMVKFFVVEVEGQILILGVLVYVVW